MRKEMISELCRFYQGEEKCPFEGDALKLWDIERIYFEALRDADKLSLAIASSFNAEVIDAIGRYYPSEKDELIARYNGSLREIIVSVGSGWAEAEKDAQNRLSAIRGKIASMPRDAARSFLIDEIKDHSDFSDSLLGQSYENSHDDGELVCHCFGVGINKIKKAVWENHLTTVEEVTNYTKAGGGCGSCKMRIEEIIDEVWVDLEKCGVPRPGHAPTPIPSITVSTSTTSSPAFSSIGTVASAKSATAAVNAQIDEKTKSSPIYDDVVKILKEVSDGLTDGSKVELDAISGADVIVKLEGPAASGMMKDMTLGYLKQKLTDGTGRQINVTTR